MKHLFAILLFSWSAMTFAQTLTYKDPAATDTTGISKMTVVYQYVVNTLDEDKNPVSDSIKIVLQISDGMWKCFPYDRYLAQKDTRFNPNDGIYLEALLHVQTIFTDNVNGKIIGREAVGSQCFETEEKKTYQDWTLKNETEKVLEYDCLKAECSFRGKKWNVMYSEDVPVSAGPWKLGGLPGLIMKAVDENGIHSFEAIEIFKDETPITIDKYYTIRMISLNGDSFKTIKFEKKTTKEMISLRKKVLGHKNYPQDPMMFVAPGGYQEIRYGDVNDLNVIDGVVVLDVAHKYQPLEY